MTRRRPVRRSRRRQSARGTALRVWHAAPPALRLATGLMAAVLLWAGANWIYQAARKPTELLFPVSQVLAKTPAETWREYGPQFRRHATAVITPEFLAALAQIESAANPLAQTYWRWNASLHPLRIYRPASTAVGMYQITDGSYAQTRPECRPQARDGDADSCWFDSLYGRLVPDDAIALTARSLDRAVAAVLSRSAGRAATLRQKQHLAATIHLCGPAAGAAYARRGFRPVPGQRCGDHELQAYLERIDATRELFARLARAA